MNYHNILVDDMRNGEGLRVTVFLSGCDHHCKECQNPQTWDPNSGIKFTEETIDEIRGYLSREYMQGITLSGGDPLYKDNRNDVENLIDIIKEEFPDKDIWIYTGYTYEEICRDSNMLKIVNKCDVLVDGPFIYNLADVKYNWAGSTNQKVIDINKTKKNKNVTLYSYYKK